MAPITGEDQHLQQHRKRDQIGKGVGMHRDAEREDIPAAVGGCPATAVR
jgi:hypothetical protein